MNYEELLLSENTNSKYDAWKTYREKLTDYILRSINAILIERKIKENKIRRIRNSKNNLNQLEKLEKKPTLAIWGAGGCNDIDIKLLSSYFSLVLIDDNLKATKSARERFGLKDEECVCTNLHFWDIVEDDYEMFNALINDGASIKEIEKYIMDLIDGMTDFTNNVSECFDYSICIGLSSQLNSRFVALLYDNVKSNNKYSHEELEEIQVLFRGLNDIAIDRLLESINRTTRFGIIYGYELESFYNDDSIYDEYEELVCVFDEYNHSKDFSIDIWKNVNIEGNRQLNQKLKNICTEKCINKCNLVDNKVLIWPFDDDKKYIMAYRVLN